MSSVICDGWWHLKIVAFECHRSCASVIIEDTAYGLRPCTARLDRLSTGRGYKPIADASSPAGGEGGDIRIYGWLLRCGLLEERRLSQQHILLLKRIYHGHWTYRLEEGSRQKTNSELGYADLEYVKRNNNEEALPTSSTNVVVYRTLRHQAKYSGRLH